MRRPKTHFTKINFKNAKTDVPETPTAQIDRFVALLRGFLQQLVELDHVIFEAVNVQTLGQSLLEGAHGQVFGSGAFRSFQLFAEEGVLDIELSDPVLQFPGNESRAHRLRRAFAVVYVTSDMCDVTIV